MKAEQSANLAVEIYFASLHALSKERALTNLENSSCYSPTVRLYETSNQDTVTNFDLFHGPTLSKNSVQVIRNYPTQEVPPQREFAG